QQLAHRPRVKQCTRQAVLANLPRLFEYVDIFFAELRIGMFAVMLVDQLRQAQPTSHARRPATNNDNISRHLRAVDILARMPEN
ncbi:MAG TPA: hypothetical protein VJS37_13795, partial [Terriglobales bacterium]|nr:hypothetical protein [Terriglobales bacterium]